jgi:BirA family biotin operon repressor/biotin-[acetyl-CoA-carboxylase] ligase
MTFTLGSRALSAGYRLSAFDSIGSTNAEALFRARQGERGPIWFVTSDQTAGRGRRHRPWIAPRGNLAASILQTLDMIPATAATLGFAAGLALAAALRRASGNDAMGAAEPDSAVFSLKWPNDVLAGGGKLAGILLEAEAVAGSGLAMVVGIGTNVLGIAITAEDLFAVLSDSWVEFYEIWDQGRGFGEIRRLWLEQATGVGRPVAVHTGGAVIEGTFETVDDAGCMTLRTSSGDQVSISAGDVYFGSAASAGTA